MSSELTRRWAVAAVGVPLVLLLLYLGGWWLAVPVAALAAVGASECYGLAERTGVAPFRWIGMTAAGAMVLLAAWRPTFTGFAPGALALAGGVTAADLAEAIFGRGPEGHPLAAVGITIFGVLYAGLSLAFVPLLHALPTVDAWGGPTPVAWIGLLVVALPLAATWIGDATAYFAGSAWGTSKLAPSISPKKSWVGAWAGMLGGAVAGAVWYLVAEPHLPNMPVGSPLASAAIGALLGVGALLGDLEESLLKREAGVKDSGWFFPGHGGVLDRLDALTVNLPLSYIVLVALEALT